MKQKNHILLFCIGIPLISSFIAAIAFLFWNGSFILSGIIMILAGMIGYGMNHKKLTPVIFIINALYMILFYAIFTILMVVSSGAVESPLVQGVQYILFPYFPMVFWSAWASDLMELFPIITIQLIINMLITYSYTKEQANLKSIKRLAVVIIVIAVGGGVINYNLYNNRPAKIYAGHGFAYMNGYSSTDFTDYTVYAKNSKLVTLDHEPEFMIEKEEDMPILDGAEACYPFYASVAKTLYKDIDLIERNTEERYDNGIIVTFTNTIQAFERLLNQEVDLIFGARPSKSQLQEASEAGVELEVTPIGKEAFVFFVEEDNPVDNLTSEQIKEIYSGKITNWKEVGGKDQEIVAFQRPENSGSQTMMQYFMSDVPLKEPKTFETVSSMEGIISTVAQYHNEAGAMGYSFKYFIEGLQQEKNVKILSINGIAPTNENIQDGSYPLTTNVYMISRVENNNEYVEKVKEFILSKDGQYLVEKNGYCPLA